LLSWLSVVLHCIQYFKTCYNGFKVSTVSRPFHNLPLIRLPLFWWVFIVENLVKCCFSWPWIINEISRRVFHLHATHSVLLSTYSPERGNSSNRKYFPWNLKKTSHFIRKPYTLVVFYMSKILMMVTQLIPWWNTKRMRVR